MKVLLTAFCLLFSTLSFSQVNGSGMISIGNGQTTIGISVGNNNPNQDQLVQRMLRLERAVRDLQIQVYHLTANEMPRAATALFECRVEGMRRVYRGEGDTKAVAKSNALKACEYEENAMFCDDVTCEQLR